MDSKKEKRIAEQIRNACIQAATEGFENASMSGLCMEGAIEAAIGAIRSLKVENILSEIRRLDQ